MLIKVDKPVAAASFGDNPFVDQVTGKLYPAVLPEGGLRGVLHQAAGFWEKGEQVSQGSHPVCSRYCLNHAVLPFHRDRTMRCTPTLWGPNISTASATVSQYRLHLWGPFTVRPRCFSKSSSVAASMAIPTRSAPASLIMAQIFLTTHDSGCKQPADGKTRSSEPVHKQYRYQPHCGDG